MRGVSPLSHYPKHANRRKSNGGKYWLTPDHIYDPLNAEFNFDFDPCPYPRPPNFDSLQVDWGQSNYCNPPFSSDAERSGGDKGVGPTAWMRKAIAEMYKGRTSVVMLPVPHYVNLALEAGGEIRSLGRVRWLETTTGEPMKSPFAIGAFILRGRPAVISSAMEGTSMDVKEAINKLQAQRDEIDAALRQLTKVAYNGQASAPVVKKSHHKQVAPGTTTTRKKHVFTAAEKANLSKKVKAYWKKRKAAEAAKG
jgi:hypothetical protein